MKKLLILLFLFASCSAENKLSEEEQRWVNSVYDQGWYWPLPNSNPIQPSNDLVPFQSDGSFVVGRFYPWDDSRLDLPVRFNTRLKLDEVLSDSEAYYRFTYRFNNEDLTLYRDIFHGTLDISGEPGIFWGSKENYTPPAVSTSVSEKRAWLLDTYSKDKFAHKGYALGLKKRGRVASSTSKGSVKNYSLQGSNLVPNGSISK